jgi:hypothetical protein
MVEAERTGISRTSFAICDWQFVTCGLTDPDILKNHQSAIANHKFEFLRGEISG